MEKNRDCPYRETCRKDCRTCGINALLNEKAQQASPTELGTKKTRRACASPSVYARYRKR